MNIRFNNSVWGSLSWIWHGNLRRCCFSSFLLHALKPLLLCIQLKHWGDHQLSHCVPKCLSILQGTWINISNSVSTSPCGKLQITVLKCSLVFKWQLHDNTWGDTLRKWRSLCKVTLRAQSRMTSLSHLHYVAILFIFRVRSQTQKPGEARKG